MNNNGFITIMASLIIVVIMISTIYLMYTYNLEYKIANSSINSIQSNYSAESKIYLTLNKEEYYNNQLIPRVERYIKYGRITPIYDYKVCLDYLDLIEGDSNNIVNIRFFEKGETKILELSTNSPYNGITKTTTADISILNNLYEMGVPIVSTNNLSKERIDEFNNYMYYLQEEIKVPLLEEDIFEISLLDYEELKIIKNKDGRMNIEFFRNNIENPIKKEVLTTEGIFLLAKKDSNIPTISISTENSSDKVKLEGVIYVEGDMNIYNDFNFNGILIIDGKIIIHSAAEVNIEGIVFLDGLVEEFQQKGNFKVNYNFDKIREYGNYLPKFIDLRIQTIKSV